MYLSHNYSGVKNPLRNHLLNVANGCGSGLFFNVGLLHDFGKYRGNFQRYLNGDDVAPADKTHAVAGARFLHQHMVNKVDPVTLSIGMIAIACHHTGLQDDVATRLSGPAANKEFSESLNPESIQLHQLLQLMTPIMGNIAMATRMTLSKLVHADWTDASKIYGNYKEVSYSSIPTLVGRMDKFVKSIGTNNLSTVRNKILAECNDKSSSAPGWFSLEVPTGGGKTISGMSFALHHANAYNKQRVIVVIPYTSIIDQSHMVYSGIFGDEDVLAHHSNIQPTSNYRFLSQTWDSPIIVTTTVQFLETLMTNKNKKLRKLQNIANSVIILDECQMLPLSLMDATMDALKSLVDDHGCTIVLSSATQYDYKNWGVNPRPIISDYAKLHSELVRTNIEFVPDFDIKTAIISGGSSLTVVNTRAAALSLYNEVSQFTDCYYLSTLMCAAHRREVIADINTKLSKGEIVKIISTQLIEAGVDIDLPDVYREIAGVDNIIQAAGRCNRNGNLPIGRVVVFEQISEFLPMEIEKAIALTKKTMLDVDLNDCNAATIYSQKLIADTNTDLYEIMSLHDPRPHQIKFAEIAKRYKIIDDASTSIICPIADFDMSDPNAVQPYLVNLYDKDLKNLIKLGAITQSDHFENMYVLTDPRWYHPNLGVVIDTAS